MTPEQIKKLLDDMEEITKRLEELEAWKKARETQQITLPIDPTSQTIIKNTFNI